MNLLKTMLAVLMALVGWVHISTAQDSSNRLVVEYAPILNSDLNGPGPLAPTVEGAYTIIPGLGVENPIDGSSLGFYFGVQPDPNTGVVNVAIMDNQASLIGTDFADSFGIPSANEIVAYECIESLGIDPDSGRFLLRLTLTVETTATELQWDSLEFDLLDPADIDGDGNTNEPDGQLDTGDGIADQPFPLDPVGLVMQIDLDEDGDPTNDPPSPFVTQGLFIGQNAGGVDVPFDTEAGVIRTVAATWELRNFAGELADINLDSTADGPFELDLTFCPFKTCPFDDWQGNLGLGFGVDGDINTVQELVSGTVKTNRFIITYLSDVERAFCFGMTLLGDVNLDGVVNLLDIQPFVNLLATQSFQAEADINGDGVVDLLDIAGFVRLLQSN